MPSTWRGHCPLEVKKMHEPGVKPNLKEEWKQLPKKLKAGVMLGATVTAMIIALAMIILLVGQFREEYYTEFFRIMFASVLMGVGLLWFHHIMEGLQAEARDMRVKEGLRSTWDDEDHDELEKRVKALEEKLRG